MVFPPVEELVPGLIPVGASLAGRPSQDRQELASRRPRLAVAGNSTVFGGIRPVTGDVLYFALEDNRPRLQRRLDKLQAMQMPALALTSHAQDNLASAERGRAG